MIGTLVREQASIVLLGHFNPAIFQPAWFASHDLLRKEEADIAQVQVIAPQLCQFKADWLELEVTSDRFSARTPDTAHTEPLRDLVLGTFALLEHTPFDKMGLNRNMHFRAESEEVWHKFGHELAPKAIWQKILRDPGLLELVIQGSREKAPHARIQIKVQPSVPIKPGIYIAVNEHYDASAKETPMLQLMTILRDSWRDARVYALEAAETLMREQQ
jgi:hypothetical protein